MAGKNWQAGGRNSIPAQALVCLLAIAVPCGLATAAPSSSGGFAPTSYVGELDPNMIWELLIGGIVVASFLAAAGLWVLTALRRVKRSQLRRSAFVSSALNNLNQGVVMTDAQERIIFCNDRYFEIYGLIRSDVPAT
jgi:Transcriptional regulator containing PAS, AAA-type ATPase, and DNA-binding domains